MTAEQDAAIFNDFVFGDPHYFDNMLNNALRSPMVEAEQDEVKKALLKKKITADITNKIEDSARAMAEQLLPEDRDKTTKKLLEKLGLAKEANPRLNRRELLKIPYINALVNTLVFINGSLVSEAIKDFRKAHHSKEKAYHSKERYRELKARALHGDNPLVVNPTGAIGAILAYDRAKGTTNGGDSFSTYITTAIHHALLFTDKETEAHKRTIGEDGWESSTWVDEIADPPHRRVMEEIELTAIDDCVQYLSEEKYRDAVRYMIDTIRKTNQRPSWGDVAAHIGLGHHHDGQALRITGRAFDELGEIVRERYPQLLQEAHQGNVNGWGVFNQVFKEFEKQDSVRRKQERGRQEREQKGAQL